MQAVLFLALAGAEADLVGAVIVEDGTAPQALELGAQRALGVGPQERREILGLERAYVAAEFLLARLGETDEIFGKAHPDIDAAIEGKLDLAPARRDDAAAAGDRHDAEIIVARLVEAPAEHRHRAGRRDLHHVARSRALDVLPARRAEGDDLPLGRTVQRHARLARGAAAGLQLERMAAHIGGRV